MTALSEFNEQDLRATLNRALRTVAVCTLVGLPVVWRAWGWRSMILYFLGAVIAATGIFEWRQLMAAVLDRLQASDGGGREPRPMGPVLFWFFLRLAAAAALLYLSLKTLGGRPIALVLGLALAMVALLIEALRLFHAWSM
jgi:hypothetical protein